MIKGMNTWMAYVFLPFMGWRLKTKKDRVDSQMVAQIVLHLSVDRSNLSGVHSSEVGGISL